jgi:hypothetical protein
MEYRIRLGVGGADFDLYELASSFWMKKACCDNKKSLRLVGSEAVRQYESSSTLKDSTSYYYGKVLSEINVQVCPINSPWSRSKTSYIYSNSWNTIVEKRTILGASNAAAKRLKYNPQKDNRSNANKAYVGVMEYWHGLGSEYYFETDMTMPELQEYIRNNVVQKTHQFFWGGKGIKGHVDNFAVDVELAFHDKISMTRIPNAETFTRFPLWPDLMSSNGKGKELLIILPFGDEIDTSFVSKSRKRPKNEWIPY